MRKKRIHPVVFTHLSLLHQEKIYFFNPPVNKVSDLQFQLFIVFLRRLKRQNIKYNVQKTFIFSAEILNNQ